LLEEIAAIPENIVIKCFTNGGVVPLKKQYIGLDMLRGLGVFLLIWLHSAFYYFDGLYDLDLNNPPVIVTVIGLLLMFAGLFAMVSGTSHAVQYGRKLDEQGYSLGRLIKYNTVSGFFILTVAYTYFIFTGPGLVDFTARKTDNSILVELIRYGHFSGSSLDRLLYIDSLVMIGMNVLLLGLIFALVRKTVEKHACARNPSVLLILGILLFLISAVRIPFYEIYISAVEHHEYGKVIALNWLVNKNNPILPFISFAVLGAWFAALLKAKSWGMTVLQVIPVAFGFLTAGVSLYIMLPDTMLQRSIDPKWYAVMTAQVGLFLMLILAAVWLFDMRAGAPCAKELKPRSKFFYRFGVAGLTVFFFESVASAIIYRILKAFFPYLSFGMDTSLIYGFLLAISWGLFLMLWEMIGYRYGLEHLFCRIMNRFGSSAKAEKLGGAADDACNI